MGLLCNQGKSQSAELEMFLSVSMPHGDKTVLTSAIHSATGSWLGVEGDGSRSGFISGFRLKGKGLCLALSQVNTGVTLSLMPVMTNSKSQILSESQGKGGSLW